IRHLPHDLVAAFRSTLQESREANLLLHVVDASSDQRDENIEQVDAVLKEIGADEVPQLLVYNKIDRIEGASPRVDLDEHGNVARIWLSALSGTGINSLREVLQDVLAGRALVTGSELCEEAHDDSPDYASVRDIA
ncbi:MAG: GTPase HflX, partial [Granulosicoccaceae bacterium]